MSNTDDIRRTLIETGQPQADLAVEEGPTWDTEAMRAEFEPLGFAAPYIVVRRRSDGAKGTLEFTHGPPRIYFAWKAD